MNDQKTALQKIAGANNVLDSQEILEAYSKDQSFVQPMKPSLVVKPSNVDEVQKIVKWANATKTPLVPVSSGAPHFRGDTVPSVPDAVIVDLSGMKKILSINRRHRIAVIEPGVTYGELQAALAKEGLRLATSLTPRENKSVVTSLLEIEPRLNPRYQWAYTDPLRCIEIVWGDGNKLWTGEAGSGIQDLEKQWEQDKRQIAGVGPIQVDFYRLATAAQGSMGIVTWASVKCEILPQAEKLNFVSAAKPEELLDFVYKVLSYRYGDELMIMNSEYLASILGQSVEQMKTIKNDLPQWIAMVSVAGRSLLPEDKVDYQVKDITEIAQQFGLKLEPELAEVNGKDVLETLLKPSGESYWKLRSKGGVQEIFFVTTLDKTPKFIATMNSLAQEAGFTSSNIGVYIQPQHQGTSCHCEFILPYDPASETAKVQKLFTDASKVFLQMGAYFSRPYGAWSALMFKQDAETTMSLQKVKSIFDPNNVMNRGKLLKYEDKRN